MGPNVGDDGGGAVTLAMNRAGAAAWSQRLIHF